MIRIARFIIAIAFALFVTSCGPTAPGENNRRLWTDPSTGCVYIVYKAGAGTAAVGSLSIRFRRDGKPDCPGAEDRSGWGGEL